MWRRHLLIYLFCIIILMLPILNCLAASSAAYNPLFLAVSINRQDLGQTTLFLQDNNQHLWATKQDLENWRFNLAGKSAISYDGNEYYALNDFPELHYDLNMAALTISITSQAGNFRKTEIDASHFMPLKVNRPSPGGFINYDLSAQKVLHGDSATSGGIFELGGFNKYGVGTSEFLATNSNNSTQFLRLQTTWTNDQPEQMRSWRLGDSFTNGGIWGQSVGFGGIQIASNFGTQPSFVPFPLPSTSGEAILPSTIDLYTNNVLMAKNTVNNGPFNLVNIPVVNGYGDLTVTSTDLLGRQQTITLPYYMSTQLLKPGLHEYSYEAGFIRNNLGTTSNDYGRFAVVATDAMGINDKLTGQWHTEALTNQQTFGVGANYLWKLSGVFTVAAAASHSNANDYGGLALVGFQRQANNRWNYGANVQVTTHDFRQLAIQSGSLAPSMQAQTFVGIPLPKSASLGLSYTVQENREQPSYDIVSASYSQTLFKNWSVSLTALANVSGVKDKAVYLSLSRAFGANTGFTTGTTSQSNLDLSQSYAQLNRALPAGPGYGYNLMAGTGELNQYQAAVSAQNNIGTYSVEAANLNGQQGFSAGASGGIVFMDRPYLTRNVSNSFGVVTVGYPNVRVYQFNQEVATTDSKGNALLPNLIAYQTNPIRIEPKDLPFDAEILQTQADIVPYYRSGVKIPFEVKAASAAILTVTDANNQVIPAGAIATLNNTVEPSIVGEDGELYLTGLLSSNDVNIQWEGHQCHFRVNYTALTDPLPNLGTYICREATP